MNLWALDTVPLDTELNIGGRLTFINPQPTWARHRCYAEVDAVSGRVCVLGNIKALGLRDEQRRLLARKGVGRLVVSAAELKAMRDRNQAPQIEYTVMQPPEVAVVGTVGLGPDRTPLAGHHVLYLKRNGE